MPENYVEFRPFHSPQEQLATMEWSMRAQILGNTLNLIEDLCLKGDHTVESILGQLREELEVIEEFISKEIVSKA